MAIKLDQAGYLPVGPKIAMIVAPPNGSTSPERFRVLRSLDESVVLEGRLSAAVPDGDSGDDVSQADFTALHETGKYYLDVPDSVEAGTSRSVPTYSRVFIIWRYGRITASDAEPR